MRQIPRQLTESVLFALQNNPAVFLNGPRQAGKSTLVRHLAKKAFPASYTSFDNVSQMTAAANSPELFIDKDHAMIIDEVQMVPEIFRALKINIDEKRLSNKAESNGRFLLTGSANIMALPQLSNALVGRMSVKTLYPFSASEGLGTQNYFLENLFKQNFKENSKDFDLNQAIRMATFPDIAGKSLKQRDTWFDDYLTTILQRDVRMLIELEKISILPNLLRTLAVRAGSLVNDAEISRDIGLNAVTSKRYRGILQAMFLNFDIPPWHRNIGKRLVKSSKTYLIDTLLLCHLLDWRLEDCRDHKPQLYGHLVENFVANELVKLLSFGDIRASLLHFRTSDNQEVDFVLERPDGGLAGIEVKTSSRVDVSDFKGLKVLKEVANTDFVCGIVLYSGKETIIFGDRLFAVPLSSLWQ